MAALLTGAFSAQGAGLGKLSVYSGIGQQLNAEVALSATPAELNSMSAKLASQEAFREAGVEFMSLLSDVRITLEKSETGQPILKLTTVRPITEPFLHFLVELSWSSGRMIREYTFLLDPPELLQIAKPASVVTPATPAMKSLPPPTQVQAAEPARAPAPVAKQATPVAGEYQVKPGDTLGKIARETRADTVSLDQMLVALFNGNQEAFSGNNMNRLRAGKILRVPNAEEAGKVDPAEARKLVIGQAGEFNAYRNRLAGAAAETPATEATPKQQAAGTIKPRVEDKVPAPAAKDKLEVSRTEPAKEAKAPVVGGLEEDLIARDKALKEASERIVMLEKNIDNLKKLVEVKSQTGAKLQQESQAAQPKPAESPIVAVKPEVPAATPPVPAAPVEPPAKSEEPKPAVPAPVAEKSAERPLVASPPQQQAKKPVAPPPLPAPEPSFVEENPEIVYGGGGLIALLLGYFGYSSWRRKKALAEAEQADFAEPPVSYPSEGQEAKPASAPTLPASSFDTGEISIQGDFSESGLLTNEEIVDPVAEAEVLMAYGRDRQAEEILQEGLSRDPARSAIHMKLLELYARQENIAQFETIAEKLHALTSGRGVDWDKTLAMARNLGLSGGIFGGMAVPAEAVAPAAAVEFVEPSVTVQPEPAVEAAEVVLPPLKETAPVAEEIPSLEFDLDLGTTSKAAVAEAVTAAEQAAAAAAKAEDMSLDFDFDLGTPEAKEAVEEVIEKATAASRVELNEMDFDLDLGSPVEADAALPETKQAEMVEATEGRQEIVKSAQEMPAGGVADLHLDFDLDLDQPPESSASSEYPSAPAESRPPSAAFDQDEVAKGALEEKHDNPEVATKLELAQAYEEMGDLEGARELLNEVVNEGSETQQAQARAKLDQLSV